MDEKWKELNKRKSKRQSFYIFVILLFLLLYIVALVGLEYHFTDISADFFLLMIVVFFLFLIFLAIIGFGRNKDFNDLYQESVTRVALEDNFEVDTFLIKPLFIPDSIITCTTYYHYTCDECAKGTYKDSEFEQCEITLYRKNIHTGSRYSSITTYFEGNWLVFHVPELLSEPIKINFGTATKKLFLPRIFLKDNEKLRMMISNPPPDNRLSVYATDEEDFSRLISTDFLEKIKIAAEVTDCHIIVGILKNEVHILFNRYRSSHSTSSMGLISDDTVNILRREFSYTKVLIDCFLATYKNTNTEKNT